MSSIFEETGGLLPSELMPVYKNHQALPISGSNESLKELLDNYAYPNPYECSVYSGTAPADGVKYYIPDLGLAEGVLWHIKYFPGDAAGGATMIAHPASTEYGIMTRVASVSGWNDWIESTPSGGSSNHSDWVTLEEGSSLFDYVLSDECPSNCTTLVRCMNNPDVPPGYSTTSNDLVYTVTRSSNLYLNITANDLRSTQQWRISLIDGAWGQWVQVAPLTGDMVTAALGYTPASAVSSGQPTEAQIGDIWISDT